VLLGLELIDLFRVIQGHKINAFGIIAKSIKKLLNFEAKKTRSYDLVFFKI